MVKEKPKKRKPTLLKSLGLTGILVGGIPVIMAAFITGGFNLLHKAPAVGQTKSPNAIQAVQSGSNNSQTIQTGSIGIQALASAPNSVQALVANATAGIQAPFAVSGGNNYIFIGSDASSTSSLTRLEIRLNSTETNVAITRDEMKLMASALREIEDRTSGLTRLPDGRTKFVSSIGGTPTFVIAEDNLAITNLVAGNFIEALKHSENAIRAFEETKAIETNRNSIVSWEGQITPEGELSLYRRAATICFGLAYTSNDMPAYYKSLTDSWNATNNPPPYLVKAYEYSQKAIINTNDPRTLIGLQGVGTMLGRFDDVVAINEKLSVIDASNTSYSMMNKILSDKTGKTVLRFQVH